MTASNDDTSNDPESLDWPPLYLGLTGLTKEKDDPSNEGN
jgi:hypothetical protein